MTIIKAMTVDVHLLSFPWLPCVTQLRHQLPKSVTCFRDAVRSWQITPRRKRGDKFDSILRYFLTTILPDSAYLPNSEQTHQGSTILLPLHWIFYPTQIQAPTLPIPPNSFHRPNSPACRSLTEADRYGLTHQGNANSQSQKTQSSPTLGNRRLACVRLWMLMGVRFGRLRMVVRVGFGN